MERSGTKWSIFLVNFEILFKSVNYRQVILREPLVPAKILKSGKYILQRKRLPRKDNDHDHYI